MNRLLSAVAALTVASVICFHHTAAAAESTKPVKVGALFSVTGPASFLGAPQAKTARMVIDKINAAGGVNGRKLELVLRDTASSPEKAVSFARQLIEEDKVLAIIGPSTSGETMQIKNVCEENKMLLISCAAAEVIVNPLAPHVFKVAPKDSQAVLWIYKTMKENGCTKIAVLSSNDGFGSAGKKQVEDLAKTEGMEILVNEVYDKQATDLTEILTKVKSKPGVQAVLNWSIVPAQSIVPKNMKQIGLNVPLYQSHGFANRKYAQQAGIAAEGILFPASRIVVADELPADHRQKAVVTAYRTEYEAQFKEDVSTFGGHVYDALMVLTEAMKKAGSADPAKVRAAIENVKGLAGTAGVFSFSKSDHTGLDADAFAMLTVKDGKFTLYRK